ncbi:hypothetical protein KW794_03240 [Candidatus Saccharibacteria bacterium]|nr:hypothetical protein [Candidatus Saccharibacteria bacterium]
MAKGYVYKKPVNRSHYSRFRRYLITTVVLLILFGGVGYYIYSGLHASQKPSALSAVEKTEITGSEVSFTNDYFEFQDSAGWVVDKNNSTKDKLVYHKFNKSVILAEMVAYINQDPIPLYSATPRALPVRIVNNNSLQATNVSSPCVGQYAKTDPHKVKEVSINNATMLCDPDSPQYFIIFAEINGDYHLHLKRSNGTPIEFVITYKDLGLNPRPDSILNIATSFKTK